MSNFDRERGTKQISYFSAGPSKLPQEVLDEIQRDVPKHPGSLLSVLEMNHCSPDFDRIITEAETMLRELLKIPSNYQILFLQGGGTGQFAGVPMNLLSRTGKADYFVTGLWSRRAARECQKYGIVNFVLPKTQKFTRIPPREEWSLSPDASYVFYCDNETVDGLEFDFVPEVPEGIPLVCDMSSNICTRPVDVSKFGIIFAGAQKNIGCAGVTVVIVRQDLIGGAMKICPTVFDYEVMARTGSRRNTTPTFSVSVLGRMLAWIRRNGGIANMEEMARKKSQLLYSLIDQSGGYYCNIIDLNCRSRMNVTFRIGGPEGNDTLENKFLEEAASEGLLYLKGHRPVFGIRASLYNSITMTDVLRLADFMKSFKENNSSLSHNKEMTPMDTILGSTDCHSTSGGGGVNRLKIK